MLALRFAVSRRSVLRPLSSSREPPTPRSMRAREQRRCVSTPHGDHRMRLWNEEAARQKSLAGSTAADDGRKAPAEIGIELFGGKGVMVPGRTTPLELARRYNQKRARQYVVARINGKTPWDMQIALPAATRSVECFGFADEKDIARPVFWRSSAHIMGAALSRMYGNQLMLCSSAAVPNDGFYSDFFLFSDPRDPALDPDGKGSLSFKERIDRLCGPGMPLERLKFMGMEQTEELRRVVLDIARGQHAFEHMDVDHGFAQEMFAGNPFDLRALDLAQRESEGKGAGAGGAGRVALFRCCGFVGIRREPLIVNTRQMQEFAATSVSSVHSAGHMSGGTRGGPGAAQQTPPTLNRIHAISFPTAAMHKQHQQKAAETARRNHRLVGKQQKLFMMHPWAPGSGFILPHGQRMVGAIMAAIRREYARHGFDEVSSPLMYNRRLWEKSGHWENYRDDMFTISSDALPASEPRGAGCCGHRATEPEQAGAPEFGLKPMNCPGHCLIYANEPRSYRDLPIRYADFSPLHRNEIAGALSGLTRVRKFHQDDGHIFCTREQVQGEIESCIKMVDSIYGMFGFPSYEFALSTRPDRSIGDACEWSEAEEALAEALTRTGKTWTRNEGDGAFYGPKIDVRVQDALGRRHQTATIQLDFQLPRRFELKYTGVDGQQHRPAMIHRAVLGSMERMLAILIEHWGGHWPFWISPRQAMVIPVTTSDEGGAIAKYAQRVRDMLANDKSPASVDSHRFFVDVDLSGDTLGRSVRASHLAKYSFTLVVGEAEMREETVHVRKRGGGKACTMKIQDVKDMFQGLVEAHR
ncbi:hypothetical protein IW140_006464 [Coemansia sp. RSA 1813]|nr:hypothetical protein EV178_006430 [Coemansia sp. RSA 1646]KAJ1765223.1 hypothetical protein LPJ74_006437 [Coemansia sp. RSA 1843]KAJ2085240.1 hypothetical protein IW138_006435 [Coemansia sp. RSA 986]KAJ2210262.1 hypothetical protein EV179_006355 [Coemansia sp. RSA 487]KAJ2562191.1 hypothetical protein IW140_006464 [Coemansia sp. RSA 1813]